MTFTYDLTAPVEDVSRVRFHLGDTNEATAIYSDEEIAFAIEEEGSWQGAVIGCIRGVLARLAGEPDMTADWLRVDWRRSVDGWKMLLKDKERLFGIGGARASSGGQHAWRPDGLLEEAPTWENEAETDYDCI